MVNFATLVKASKVAKKINKKNHQSSLGTNSFKKHYWSKSMEMLIHSIKLWGNASIMENFKPLTNYLDDAIFI